MSSRIAEPNARTLDRKMERRRFIAATAGVIGAVTARAQQRLKARRIGFLSNGPPFTTSGFWRPLWKLGWVENQTLSIEERFADGRPELLQGSAAEMVRGKVDLIVALGTVAGIAAKRATDSLPIVVHRAADPVSTGLVASLARPGGNITGTTTITDEFDPKRIELLREVLPGISRIGEWTYPLNPIHRLQQAHKEAVYRAFNLQAIFVSVLNEGEFDSAVTQVVERAGQALSVSTEPLFSLNFAKIAQLAKRYSLPVIGGEAELIYAGALIGFGPSQEEYLDTLASIVDKVLRGAKPADVPVQQPTKFELGVNLRVAQALGVKVSRSVLLRADGVVQ